MFDILKKVLKPVGPSGLEEPVAAAIREEVQGCVDSIETDAMGNLICVKKGTDPKEAYEKNVGTYGRFANAAKYIDPRNQ